MEALPFLDCEGNKIFEGSLIGQTNFNGEEYEAVYKVVKDGADDETGGYCLQMLEGNTKAMRNSDQLSAFGSMKNGRLRKGWVLEN